MSENLNNFANITAPKILIAGVGGAGINILNTIIKQGIQGVSFLAMNTDAQSLGASAAESKIALGSELTKGYGTGSNPEIGKAAASENKDVLKNYLKDYSLVFFIGGLGGGTGSGALPVLSQIAKDLNILSINIITMPFEFEGLKRKKIATEALTQIGQNSSSYMIIPNENFFASFEENLSAADAFINADISIANAIKAITDIINTTGQINLDFADIKSILENGGQIMVNSYTSTGDEKVENSIKGVMQNLLIDKGNANGADQVLLQISGGTDITLSQIKQIMTDIKKVLNTDENFIFGTNFDKTHQGELTLSLIATGLTKGAHNFSRITVKPQIEPIKMEEKSEPSIKIDEPIAFIPIEDAEETTNIFADEKEQPNENFEEEALDENIEQPAKVEEEPTIVEEIDPFSYDEVIIEEYIEEEPAAADNSLDVSSIFEDADEKKSFLKSIFDTPKKPEPEEKKEEKKEEKAESKIFTNTDFSDLFSSLSPIDDDGEIDTFLKNDED